MDFRVFLEKVSCQRTPVSIQLGLSCVSLAVGELENPRVLLGPGSPNWVPGHFFFFLKDMIV